MCCPVAIIFSVFDSCVCSSVYRHFSEEKYCMRMRSEAKCNQSLYFLVDIVTYHFFPFSLSFRAHPLLTFIVLYKAMFLPLFFFSIGDCFTLHCLGSSDFSNFFANLKIASRKKSKLMIKENFHLISLFRLWFFKKDLHISVCLFRWLVDVFIKSK